MSILRKEQIYLTMTGLKILSVFVLLSIAAELYPD